MLLYRASSSPIVQNFTTTPTSYGMEVIFHSRARKVKHRQAIISRIAGDLEFLLIGSPISDLPLVNFQSKLPIHTFRSAAFLLMELNKN